MGGPSGISDLDMREMLDQWLSGRSFGTLTWRETELSSFSMAGKAKATSVAVKAEVVGTRPGPDLKYELSGEAESARSLPRKKEAAAGFSSSPTSSSFTSSSSS